MANAAIAAGAPVTLQAQAALKEAVATADGARYFAGSTLPTGDRIVGVAQGDGMTALHWAADRGDAELTAAFDAGVSGVVGRIASIHSPAADTFRVGGEELQ